MISILHHIVSSTAGEAVVALLVALTAAATLACAATGRRAWRSWGWDGGATHGAGQPAAARGGAPRPVARVAGHGRARRAGPGRRDVAGVPRVWHRPVMRPPSRAGRAVGGSVGKRRGRLTGSGVRRHPVRAGRPRDARVRGDGNVRGTIAPPHAGPAECRREVGGRRIVRRARPAADLKGGRARTAERTGAAASSMAASAATAAIVASETSCRTSRCTAFGAGSRMPVATTTRANISRETRFTLCFSKTVVVGDADRR
jgi:hypothetical protein